MNTGANHTPCLNHFQTFHSRFIQTLSSWQSAKGKKAAFNLAKLWLTIKTWIKLQWKIYNNNILTDSKSKSDWNVSVNLYFFVLCLFVSSFVLAQVAQARNMTIGEHRHCCVTFIHSFMQTVFSLYKGRENQEKTVYIKTHKTAINGLWTTQERRNTHFK